MGRSGTRSGQSLIEVLVGVALGAIFIIGTAALVAPSLKVNTQLTKIQTKAQLANELSENVRSWASGNWGGVLALATGSANTYYLKTATSTFVATSGKDSVVINAQTFQRYFYLLDVYRDNNGSVTTTASGNNYDPSTKSVTVVAVAVATTSPGNIILSSYVMRSANDVVSQTSWAGGAGESRTLKSVGTTYASSSNVTTTASGAIQLGAPSGGSCVQ